ncbi:hypothetical protein R6Q59_001776 [Mikania micrantha]
MDSSPDDYKNRDRTALFIIMAFASFTVALLLLAFSYYCYLKIPKRPIALDVLIFPNAGQLHNVLHKTAHNGITSYQLHLCDHTIASCTLRNMRI